MKELIASLGPGERATLAAPNFIAEDEAGLITSDRSFNDSSRRISFDEILRQEGLTRADVRREKCRA
jgi:hypothetical protein